MDLVFNYFVVGIKFHAKIGDKEEKSIEKWAVFLLKVKEKRQHLVALCVKMKVKYKREFRTLFQPTT